MDSASAWNGPLLAAGAGLSAFTSGTIASITLIGVPAILTNTSNAALLAGWKCSLDMGVRICPAFAVTAGIVNLLNAYINRDSSLGRARYLVAAAVSSVAIVPFTIILMQPTNSELFRREAAARGTNAGVDGKAVELVKKWGRLNLTRSLLPAIGAVFACLAL